jgi:hypothetical protein
MCCHPFTKDIQSKSTDDYIRAEHLVWCCWMLATLPDFSLVTEVPVDFLSFSGVCFRWKSGFSSWSVLNLLKVGTEYVNLSSDSLWFCIDFWFSLWLGKLLFVGMSVSVSQSEIYAKSQWIRGQVYIFCANFQQVYYTSGWESRLSTKTHHWKT